MGRISVMRIDLKMLPASEIVPSVVHMFYVVSSTGKQEEEEEGGSCLSADEMRAVTIIWLQYSVTVGPACLSNSFYVTVPLEFALCHSQVKLVSSSLSGRLSTF